jgi:hypothetical protein
MVDLPAPDRPQKLGRLVESHAISQELVARLVSWKHPGLSAHVGEPIAPGQKQHLEDTAAYLGSVKLPREAAVRPLDSMVRPSLIFLVRLRPHSVGADRQAYGSRAEGLVPRLRRRKRLRTASNGVRLFRATKPLTGDLWLV